MLINTKLISIGNFDLKLNHLLIIGILALAFTLSFLLRSQSIHYGFELNEFDPFFNYRATQYIVDNGVNAYFKWNDTLSWYPLGRDVSSTSQVTLHLTAAITYLAFGGNLDLYDFTILFPVIFGSLSVIVIFALVRIIGGTTAGLFSALLFSVSLPILLRGSIGWFKSEPLGLFFSLLAVYLFLSGINSKNKKIIFMKIFSAGILTSFSISAWGGTQFFVIPLGLFFIFLPFLRNDHKTIIWSIPLYTSITILFSLAFERVSSNFVFGLGGISLIISSIFLVFCIFVQNKSSKNKIRNGYLSLLLFIIIISSLIVINLDFEFFPLPSYRYLNVLNPFLTTTNPLVDSISEHTTTTLAESFQYHSILMIFSGIGIWLIFQNLQNKNPKFIQNDMFGFSLILGIAGVYVSSTFIRLEIFASIALIILASLGLTILIKEFFKKNQSDNISISKMIKLFFVIGIVVLLIFSLTNPFGGDIFRLSEIPPTILNGASIFPIATTDWLDSLNWIKYNTPKNAVIASWWDYGYWISTLGERSTLSDSSTIKTDVIENIAKILLDTPDAAWLSLNEVQADYILIFVVGEKIDADKSIYFLQGGGDESKKQWFMKIAGKNPSKYLHDDGISGTDYFWNNTLLGKMIPFKPISYWDIQTNQELPLYVSGLETVYVKEIKYPINGNEPLRLVYASPSFTEEKVGPMIGVFVYEINKEYKLIP